MRFASRALLSQQTIDSKKGEVWWLKEPRDALGQELRKARPCIVVNEHYIGLRDARLVVPLTGSKDHYKNLPAFVFIRKSPGNGLEKNDAAVTSQIHAASLERFYRKGGVLSYRDLECVLRGVMFCIGCLFPER